MALRTVELNQWGSLGHDALDVAVFGMDDRFQPVGRAMVRSVVNCLMVAVALPVVALLFVWFGILRLLSFIHEHWE